MPRILLIMKAFVQQISLAYEIVCLCTSTTKGERIRRLFNTLASLTLSVFKKKVLTPLEIGSCSVKNLYLADNRPVCGQRRRRCGSLG